MTPIEISAAIQAGKAAFDTIRGIAEAVSKSESAAEAVQVTAAIAELGSRIYEMQTVIYELSRENEELRRQLDEGVGLEAFKKRYRYEQTACCYYHCLTHGESFKADPDAGAPRFGDRPGLKKG